MAMKCGLLYLKTSMYLNHFTKKEFSGDYLHQFQHDCQYRRALEAAWDWVFSSETYEGLNRFNRDGSKNVSIINPIILTKIVIMI